MAAATARVVFGTVGFPPVLAQPLRQVDVERIDSCAQVAALSGDSPQNRVDHGFVMATLGAFRQGQARGNGRMRRRLEKENLCCSQAQELAQPGRVAGQRAGQHPFQNLVDFAKVAQTAGKQVAQECQIPRRKLSHLGVLRQCIVQVPAFLENRSQAFERNTARPRRFGLRGPGLSRRPVVPGLVLGCQT